jgi:tetratricopeptide (TPR) repeat protein
VAVVRADLPRRPAHPGAYFATQEDALDWMERERANLVAAVDQAAEAYAHRDLGVARTAGHHLDRQTGPAGAEALRQLGRLHRVTGRYAEASACLRDALEVCRTLGYEAGKARCQPE